MKKIQVLLLGIAIITGFCSCSLSQSYQALEENDIVMWSTPHKNAINYQGVNRNPVIVVHGLLGAKLSDGKGDSIWGDFSVARMMKNEYIANISYPMEKGKPLSEINSNAKVDGILDVTTVAFGNRPFLYMDSYEIIIKKLNELGYYNENSLRVRNENFPPSLFTFAYDWRRDISQNVVELHRFIELKKAMLKELYKKQYNIDNADVKFDIIAHSMGGLLTRYYLQYGPQILPEDGSMPTPSDIGNDNIEKAIIVGTPNAGYVDTFIELVDGVVLYPGLDPIPPAILGTFSSYYFMLPPLESRPVVFAETNAPIDIFDVENWIKLNWGLANPKADAWLVKMLPHIKDAKERREIAIDHLTKNLRRARQFNLAMQKNMEPNLNTLMFLFVGDTFYTNAQVKIDPKTGKIAKKIEESGDGKVTVVSTRYDRRVQHSKKLFLDSPICWDAVYYCGASHMGIFKSNVFMSNLASLLFSISTERQKSLELEPLSEKAL